MRASHAFHRLSTPVVLALVLALAGSTSPAASSDAAGSDGASPAAAAAAGADEQPNASVTTADPQRYPAPVDLVDAPPAVRIAATGNPAGTTIRADIADVLLEAYQSAAAGVPASCHLPVSLLAAIGQVESGSLVGRPIDAQHRTSVLGPVLDGHGFAAVPDTDGGRWDGNATWDRAVGPMQFIPGTWRTFGVDGDGDGVANPQDIEDATASTAAYLCYGGRDLSQPAVLRNAIVSYNHSTAYLRLVLIYQQRYSMLGLDAGSSVAGLPTAIALHAVEAPTLDGWVPNTPAVHRRAVAEAARRHGPASGPNRHQHTKVGPRATAATPSTTAAAAASTGPASPVGTAAAAPAPALTESPASARSETPAATPSDTAAASPSQAPGDGATEKPADSPAEPTKTPAEPTKTPAEPTKTPAEPTKTPAEPTKTPAEPTKTPAGTPSPTAPVCPTAPPKPDAHAPSPTPSSVDPTCAPCPVGVDPTPEKPCDPFAPPPTKDPSASPAAPATEPSPSSAP